MARTRAPLFGGESRWLDRFGSVLLLSTISVVGLALVDISGPEGEVSRLAREVGSLTAAVIVGATLLIALRASGINPRRQRFFDVIVLVTVVGYAISLLADVTLGMTDQHNGISGAIAALSVIAPVIVVLRLVQHRTVTMGTLYGAIAAYLMIAVAFFFVFLTVGQFQGPFFAQPEPTSSSYMYFSLTTITTVGYGDLTALTHLGRLLATTEAVVGQVYLVTFVAMVVGLRAQEWRNRGGALTPPSDAPETD